MFELSSLVLSTLLAASAGGAVAPQNTGGGGGLPASTIINSVNDKCGRYATLRAGKSSNNWAHIQKHWITNPLVWSYPLQYGCGDSSGGTARIYYVWAVDCQWVAGQCKPLAKVHIRLVEDFRTNGFGDGKPFGAVTEYCISQDPCPSYVNSATPSGTYTRPSLRPRSGSRSTILSR